MTDTLSFTLLGTEYFCIIINILELRFKRQLRYLETFQIFHDLLLRLVWSYYSLLLRHSFSELSSQCLINYKISSGWWLYSQPSVITEYCSFSSFQVVLWPSIVSSHMCAHQYCAEYLRKTICPSLKSPLFSPLLSCSLTCELYVPCSAQFLH